MIAYLREPISHNWLRELLRYHYNTRGKCGAKTKSDSLSKVLLVVATHVNGKARR
jgi:hypothetical protein